MRKFMRQNMPFARTPLVLASAVVLIAVSVVAVVVPGFGGARAADPAMLYGRWVRSGAACDTQRGDSVIVIDGDSFTGQTSGGLAMRMKVVSIAPKPPDGLELKLQSYATPEFVLFMPFTVKDATTVVSETGIVWRKCP